MKRVLHDWILGALLPIGVTAIGAALFAQPVSAMPTTLWQHVTGMAVRCDLVSGDGKAIDAKVLQGLLCDQLAAIASMNAPYRVKIGSADAGAVMLTLSVRVQGDGQIQASLVAHRDSFIGEGVEKSRSVQFEIFAGADETARALALNDALDEILPWRGAMASRTSGSME